MKIEILTGYHSKELNVDEWALPLQKRQYHEYIPSATFFHYCVFLHTTLGEVLIDLTIRASVNGMIVVMQATHDLVDAIPHIVCLSLVYCDQKVCF
ncbi:hypothetical protein J6590_047037 [Homalodisca vitripennis]|nr:hypothetical protein J6590_047037 [Homalodisca vitripennis]